MARTRPATPSGDLDGEQRLYRDVAGSSALLSIGHRGDLDLRTRVVDAEVARAIGRGTDQIVLLGAGYDGRALRFAADSVRWFEVDSAALVTDKQRRLRTLGITPASVTWVGLNVETEDLSAALDAAGHDASRPSLFVAESMLVETTLGVSATICAALRAQAAPGSTLVATLAVAPEATRPLQALRSASGAFSQLVGAARRDELRPGDPQKLMVVTGWHVTHAERGHDHLLDRGAHQLVFVCEPNPNE
jgi:methyltransferase (TIGR00027 family)